MRWLAGFGSLTAAGLLVCGVGMWGGPDVASAVAVAQSVGSGDVVSPSATAVADYSASRAVTNAWPYFACVLGGGAHLAWQLRTVKFNDPSTCMQMFVSNRWFGAIVFAGIVAGNLTAGAAL